MEVAPDAIEKTEKKDLGMMLSVFNFLAVLAAFGYTIFLINAYSRNTILGSLLTLGLFALYLWGVYVSTREHRKGHMGTAKGLFISIGGLFLVFIADIFVCANSISMNFH
jgi:hypothetical protein